MTTDPLYYTYSGLVITNNSTDPLQGSIAAVKTGFFTTLSRFLDGAPAGIQVLDFLVQTAAGVNTSLEISLEFDGEGSVVVNGDEDLTFKILEAGAINAIIAAMGIAATGPVGVLAVAITATAGTGLYTSFLSDDVYDLYDSLVGIPDVDLQLRDSDGNFYGGAIYTDGLPSNGGNPSYTNSELDAAYNLFHNAEGEGLISGSPVGMQIQVFQGGNSTGQTFQAYDGVISNLVFDGLGIVIGGWTSSSVGQIKTGGGLIVAEHGAGVKVEGHFYDLRNIYFGDNVSGGNYDNILLVDKDTGGVLYGEGGDDVLVGLTGDDFLYGGSDDDTLHGGGGADTLQGQDGLDIVYGGDGNDNIIAHWDLIDWYDGGDDYDTVDYVFMGTLGYGISVTMSAVDGSATVKKMAQNYLSTEQDVLRNIEKIIGTELDDYVNDGQGNYKSIEFEYRGGDDEIIVNGNSSSADPAAGDDEEPSDTTTRSEFILNHGDENLASGTTISGQPQINIQGVDTADLEYRQDQDDLWVTNTNTGEIIVRIIDLFHEDVFYPDGVIVSVAADSNGVGGNGSPSYFNVVNGELVVPSGISLLQGSPTHQVADWVDGVADAWALSQNVGSPLVLDLDGDGVELVSLTNTAISWNIDADDFSEASGWVAADDGFLAIDLNGDGIVTDHSELFGDLVTDGFTVLSAYDSNADGVIDVNDTQFADLIVWQDVNQNGYSEETELFSLPDLDIVSIDLNASTPNNLEIEGHTISHVSSYTVDDGVNGAQTFDIVDAWFNYDDVNTNYIAEYDLDTSALFVVDMRGYGNLPDLHISASLDNDTSNPDSLLSLLQDFTALGFDNVFVDDHSVEAMVTDIMYRWAGVDGVDPSTRGAVDARSLEFLEKLMNDTWKNTAPNGVGNTPALVAAEEIDVTWELALNAVTGILSAQVAAASLFNDGAYYDVASDTFVGFTGFKQDGLDALLAKSLDYAQVSDKMEFWMGVVNAVDTVIGIDNLDSTALTALNTTLAASDPSLDTQELVDRIALELEFNRDRVSNPQDGDDLYGTNNDDVYEGTIGDDIYQSLKGNDILSGHIGHDSLIATSGADQLNGGLGNDNLQGGHGNDIYYYYMGHGDDKILDSLGSDKIVFGAGITLADIEFVREGNQNLRLDIDASVGGGSILIIDMYEAYSSDWVVESLEFADGSTYDFITYDPIHNGTDGDDTLNGTRTGPGGTGIDTIYGHGGDDYINGYHGGNGYSSVENYLYGGDGNDTIIGDRGVDTIYGDDGDDILKGNNGADLLYGGAGADDIRGQNGEDQIWGGDGDDIITGGLGIDVIYGDAGSDTIDGEEEEDIIYGGDGDDILSGGDDNDLLYGDAGADTIYGGKNSDTLYGGEGNDILSGDAGNDEAHGGSGDDTVSGGDGEDTLYGDEGNDILNGGDETDILYGGLGDDQLFGGSYGDSLYGGDGADIIDGEAGKDIIYGGDGADILTGGTKEDIFVFENTANVFSEIDTITDFSMSDGDKLDLSDLLGAYDPLTDAITDFIEITDNGTDSYLAVDADGGGDNYIQIATLLNITGLTDETSLENSGKLITA